MLMPNQGESKREFLGRFTLAPEVVADFPDGAQRLAVAHSVYERRNASPFASQEHPWPKLYSCSFIEPGVVFYQDLGENGETVLVKQEALAKMAKSFVGKPVINMVHEDVKPSTVADGEADGVVTKVWLDDKTGWWMCEFIVWCPKTQRNCESPAYSVSCAYEPTDVDSKGGSYHNLPYQEEVKDGTYTHLAIVTNPRYEGARIFVNSKGGSMKWRFWEKGERKNAADLDPLKTMVNVDGTDVPLQNLYDADKEEALNAEAEAKKAAEKPALNDDTVIEVEGKEKKLSDLKNAYRNKLKRNAAPEGLEKKDEVKAAADEPVGEKKPLPDLRAEKPAAEAAKEKTPEELKQADEDAKKAELEKKNADDAAKLKEDEDKKNAADAEAKKAEDDKKNADEAKKAEEKRNAGKKSFADLRNAAQDRTGDAAKINVVGQDERLARGRAKYGSA